MSKKYFAHPRPYPGYFYHQAAMTWREWVACALLLLAGAACAAVIVGGSAWATWSLLRHFFG